MKFLVVLGFGCLLLQISRAAAAPAADSSSPIPIVRSSEVAPGPDGSYRWSFETGNGIKAEEEGEQKQGPKPEETIASVRGSYSYRADDGSTVQISYTADENGFRPQGDAIPQPPEIPEAILKALEWIAHHPEEDNL